MVHGAEYVSTHIGPSSTHTYFKNVEMSIGSSLSVTLQKQKKGSKCNGYEFQPISSYKWS